MRARLSLAWLLCLLPPLGVVQGCAGNPPPTAPQPVAEPEAPQPPREPFDPSAPNEIVSEGVKSQRRFVVGDMIRAGVATTVEQGPPGLLRVGAGETFHTHGARAFFFGKLASAYHTWTEAGQPLVIEIWERGSKIGEYRNGTFLIGPEHATPRACPEDATTGLCSPAGQAAAQVPPDGAREPGAPAPSAAPPPAAVRSEPPPRAAQRSGLALGLGLGAGASDLACEGCDFATKKGLAGFLSLGTAVGQKMAVGVELTGSTELESGTKAQVYGVMAHVTRYLRTHGGPFLRAGVGLLGYREASDFRDLTANAIGFAGRLGYEIGEGRMVIAPYVGLVRTFAGADFKVDGEEIDFNAAVSNVHLGLSVGLH